HSGHLARLVKLADLADRSTYPRRRPDGWGPPPPPGPALLPGGEHGEGAALRPRPAHAAGGGDGAGHRLTTRSGQRDETADARSDARPGVDRQLSADRLDAV